MSPKTCVYICCCCREIKFDPYDDEEIVHIVRARIDDQRILSDDTIKQAISKVHLNLDAHGRIRTLLIMLCLLLALLLQSWVECLG